MHDTDWKKELVIAITLLGAGLLALPLAIYLVGAQIIGEYAPGADGWTLTSEIWFALGRGDLAAWTLVLSPFLLVQLVRLTRWIWRFERS